MKNILNKFFKTVKRNQAKEWKNIEYFDKAWKKRLELMSKYLSKGKVVTDLGCGEMWLKEYLNENIYFPVDYKKRNSDTIICDFNKKQFPSNESDIAFISGCLEYIEDVAWFVEKIAQKNSECILSYCSLDYFPNRQNRLNLAWKNHYTRENIINIFQDNSFKLISEKITESKNHIFYFKK